MLVLMDYFQISYHKMYSKNYRPKAYRKITLIYIIICFYNVIENLHYGL